MMNMSIACLACFRNEGFRKVIAAHVAPVEGVCPRCSSTESLISREGLVKAIHTFFVAGSYVAETMAPLYQMNDCNPHPARFDATLDGDAQLATMLTGHVIFNYAPALWRFGEGELKSAFDEGESIRAHAALEFVAAAPRVELPCGTRLFRVRKNPEVDETITTPAAFDPPPDHLRRSPGRWDDGSDAVLHASDDIELCLHECRVVIADQIIVATLSTARPLKLLDLTAEFADSGATPFEDPNIFARFLSLSRDEQWLSHARAVARAARELGLEGLRYRSYYAQAKHQSSALNVALFGRLLETGDLTIESVNRIRLTDARYDFSFGPVPY